MKYPQHEELHENTVYSGRAPLELRHLRHFIGVAEELHFGRAALRLHIEQSPLSRSIKELEIDLGIKLFERTTRSTRLTRAGKVFLNEARRVLNAVEQARSCMTRAAMTSRESLRIAITNNLAQPKLEELLAQCRRDEPKLDLRLSEMPVKHLNKALQSKEIEAAITLLDNTSEEYMAEPIWKDSVALVLPIHHPLSIHQHPTIEDALQYPLIVNNPETYQGCYHHIDAMLHSTNKRVMIAEQVSSLETMLMMVGAGYGIGFAISSQATLFQRSDIAIRTMASSAPSITTYLLQPKEPPSEQLLRFIARARKIGRI